MTGEHHAFASPNNFKVLSLGEQAPLISAYLYLIIAGKNIPVWVYFFVAGMVGYGARTRFAKGEREAHSGRDGSTAAPANSADRHPTQIPFGSISRVDGKKGVIMQPNSGTRSKLRATRVEEGLSLGIWVPFEQFGDRSTCRIIGTAL